MRRLHSINRRKASKHLIGWVFGMQNKKGNKTMFSALRSMITIETVKISPTKYWSTRRLNLQFINLIQMNIIVTKNFILTYINSNTHVSYKLVETQNILLSVEVVWGDLCFLLRNIPPIPAFYTLKTF